LALGAVRTRSVRWSVFATNDERDAPAPNALTLRRVQDARKRR